MPAKPGFGYGETRRARKDRSLSRSMSARQERRQKTKKEKKMKSQGHREEDGERRRKRVAEEEPEQQPPRTTTRAPVIKDTPTSNRGAWREEMSDDNDIEASGTTGIVAEEDDDDVERKLAESRARREALIAKWVNRGEAKTLDSMDADTPLVLVDSETRDGGDGNELEEVERPRPIDEKELKERRDVTNFILKQKAEHDDGDMFGEDSDKALNKASDMSMAISQTGACAYDWDDVEGYYKAKIGEVMDERYRVVEDMCGKGVFSNVIKAKDNKEGIMVAIKVMRCNDMMRKAAEKEIGILERLAKADKNNKNHVIRMLRHFDYRNHLCLVFECMWDNLRVALRKYTKNQGMSLQAVRAYTKQLIIGLRHLHRCHLIHADIKPDNILISAGQNLVKICDLGSAMEDTEVEPTPYLVSRFYRAPEIVLGAKYGFALDVFAMGCTLCELFTGKILFPGRSNNDMLQHYMNVKGKLPVKLIKSGKPAIYKKHFDENMDFLHQDTNKATRKKIVRVVTECAAKTSLLELVLIRVGKEKQASEVFEDQLYVKKSKQFSELLNQMVTLDPEKRPAAGELLNHPFVAESGSKPKEGKDVKKSHGKKNG